MVHDVRRHGPDDVPDGTVVPQASANAGAPAAIDRLWDRDIVVVNAIGGLRRTAIPVIARDDVNRVAALHQPNRRIAYPSLDRTALGWRDWQQFRRHMANPHAAGDAGPWTVLAAARSDPAPAVSSSITLATTRPADRPSVN